MYKVGVFEATIICIDSYKGKNLCGRLYNSFYNGGVTFRSAVELLLNIETMLAETNLPQSYSCRRVFRPAEERATPEIPFEDLREGKVGTFSLRILFRQNASWQGSVLWHEGRQEESFRSVLELLLLIDSALSEQLQE